MTKNAPSSKPACLQPRPLVDYRRLAKIALYVMPVCAFFIVLALQTLKISSLKQQLRDNVASQMEADAKRDASDAERSQQFANLLQRGDACEQQLASNLAKPARAGNKTSVDATFIYTITEKDESFGGLLAICRVAPKAQKAFLTAVLSDNKGADQVRKGRTIATLTELDVTAPGDKWTFRRSLCHPRASKAVESED